MAKAYVYCDSPGNESPLANICNSCPTDYFGYFGTQIFHVPGDGKKNNKLCGYFIIMKIFVFLL